MMRRDEMTSELVLSPAAEQLSRMRMLHTVVEMALKRLGAKPNNATSIETALMALEAGDAKSWGVIEALMAALPGAQALFAPARLREDGDERAAVVAIVNDLFSAAFYRELDAAEGVTPDAE